MSRSSEFNMELEVIRSFLERVAKSVDNEYSEIAQRAKASEFADEGEEDNAFFEPMVCEEIGIRATLSELNALVEWELQQLAVGPFTNEQERRKPKRPKLAWDLKRDELYRLIGEHYQVNIDDLPGSGEVEEIRRTVNAYKHRKGFKDPRPGKDTDWAYFPEQFQLEREKAFRYIETVRDFLQALWKAVSLASSK